MSNDEESHYDNSHRAFLQAFLARSVLTFEEAKPILAAILTIHESRPILPNDITQEDFTNYITTLNAALSPLAYEIRSTLPQTTTSSNPSPTRIYALVNTTSDPQTQLATTHTPDELAFIKRLLDAMFETHNTPRAEVMALTSMQAVRLHKGPAGARASGVGVTGGEDGEATQGAAGGSLTMAQAEKLLGSLVEEGWLEKSRGGYFSLSPRGLVELRGWLVETYNEPPPAADGEEEDEEDEGEIAARTRIKMCHACREIVTVGQRCSRRECLGRLHDACVTSLWRGQRERRCPVCREEWTGRDFVGERAVRGERGRGGVGAQARRSAVGVEDGEDD